MCIRHGRGPSHAVVLIGLTALVLGIGACGDDDDDDSARAGSGGKGSAGSGKAGSGAKAGSDSTDQDAAMSGSAMSEAQLPPTGASEVEAWLDQGFYMDWVCEQEANAKTDGAAATHVHGAATRVCTNTLLASSRRSGDDELPQGVASVKEVYDSKGELTDTLVSVKTDDESAGGEGWYWYESKDEEGQGLAECTGCHSAAGSDDDHPGLGDFVYFQNRN